MKLSTWIDGCLGLVEQEACAYYRAAESRSALHRWLEEQTGVSHQTIGQVDRGMKLKTYARAKAISEATNGAVTVEDLCE